MSADQTTRILLYPEGTDEEIWFADFTGGCPVPAVGEQVQAIDRYHKRSPFYEVTERKFYSTHYGGDMYALEVALKVKLAEVVERDADTDEQEAGDD